MRKIIVLNLMKGFLSLILMVVIFSQCNLIDDAIDPPDDSTKVGDTLWIHDLAGADSMFIDNSLAIGADGSIYYAKGGGTVYWTATRIVALNKENGSVKWESPPLDHIGLSSQIVVGDDGTVFAIGYYTLYAIDANTGQFRWTWKVPETVPNPEGSGDIYTYGQIGALALTDGGDLVLGSIGSGAYSRGLYCVHKLGTTSWYNLAANGWGIYSGIVAGKNGQIHYYTDIGNKLKLMSVDASTGVIQWEKEVAAVSSGANNIAINDEGFLICSFAEKQGDQRHIHRINPATGDIVWSSAAESTHGSKWVAPGGVVYQHFSSEGGINRIDAFSGNKQVFSQTLATDKIGAININEELIFANAYQGRASLGTFDPNGSEVWSVDMNGILSEPIVISNEKVIYGIINLHPVSRLPQKICAIQGNAKLSNSCWPRVWHDNRNTSNLNKH